MSRARWTSCSASARCALTWVCTSSASARLRAREQVEEALRDVVGAPHDRPHVGGVVAEGAVLAAVQAAVEPQDEQDDEHDGAAQRDGASHHQRLGIRSTRALWSPSGAARPAFLAKTTSCALLSARTPFGLLTSGEYDERSGRSVPARAPWQASCGGCPVARDAFRSIAPPALTPRATLKGGLPWAS